MTRTFTQGPIEGVIVKPFRKFVDERGWLAEIFRSDELPGEYLPAMCYVSVTLPGVLRGPHEHVDQADLFAWVGPGDFKLTLWDNRPGSPTFGNRMELAMGLSNPGSVVVPKGVVHGYRCISAEPGWVINCPNRLFKGEGRAEAVDEIRHEDDPESPFVLDEKARRAVIR
ncbi:MAG TPA: dTDP-4-dehydrorhamnose 3,5-epimerase family protein [Holophaga sp.]|nr:dTDP-4-dehydrorhamnose 3,5-epimerase family protein [Holophaga sp.]